MLGRCSKGPYVAWCGITLAAFCIIAVLPLGWAFGSSVWSDGTFSFAAYADVLGKGRQWTLLGNSLAVAAGTACLASLLGVSVAMAIEYWRVPARRFIATAVAIPFLIPSYVAAVAWIDVLGANGLLHRAIPALSRLLPDLYSPLGVIFVSSLSYYPVVALTTALALRRFDYRLLEAARLQAPPFKVFRGVLWPLIAPSVATGSIIVFLLALVGFSVPSLFQVNTYPVEIFTTVSAFYDFPAATAQAVPLLVCAVLTLMLGRWYIGVRRGWLTGEARGRSAEASPPLRWIAAALCWVLVGVSSGVPMAVLVWRSLPLGSYPEVIATAKDEILASLITAGCTATVVTVLAFSAACMTQKLGTVPSESQSAWTVPNVRILRMTETGHGRTSRWWIVWNLSLFPFILSGPIIGIALIQTWNRPGFPGLIYDSAFIVVLACAARYIFFAYRALDAAKADLGANIEDAAIVAAIPWWRRVSGITIPLLWPAIVGIWGLSFVFAMGEMDATALVCPPGVTPLPVRVLSLMHYGPSRLVAALSVVTVIVILTCAGITAALYAYGKGVRHARR